MQDFTAVKCYSFLDASLFDGEMVAIDGIGKEWQGVVGTSWNTRLPLLKGWYVLRFLGGFLIQN